jgi:large subunit ribosomal protein L24e
MVVKRQCSFCAQEIEPGTGSMFVKRDGSVFHFCSGSCRKQQLHLGRVGHRFKWTRAHALKKAADRSSAAARAPGAAAPPPHRVRGRTRGPRAAPPPVPAPSTPALPAEAPVAPVAPAAPVATSATTEAGTDTKPAAKPAAKPRKPRAAPKKKADTSE